MKTIAVPEQFLKDLYEIKCVPDLKTALEKHFGEVVGKMPKPSEGQVYLRKMAHGPDIGLVTWAGGSPNLSYMNTGEWDKLTVLEKYNDFSLMRSGTITIQVRNGKVAGATVQED